MISIQGSRDSVVRNVKQSEWLYWLYLGVVAPGSLRTFPSKKHQLCIEGYGRSGNTFAVSLMRELYPNVMVASHMHAVASLKAALRLKIPSIVLIRHPSGCLASRMIKFHSRFGINDTHDVSNFKAKKKISAQLKTGLCPNVALWHLREYLDMYTYVERQQDQVEIFEFETLIHEAGRFVEIVCNLLGKTGQAFDMRAVEAAKQSIRERLAADNRPEPERPWPSAEKNMLKKQVLQQMIGFKEFEDACAVYKRLTGRC